MDFAQLAEQLWHGREIEFVYKGRAYSVTNHTGQWHLCDDTEHMLLQTRCRFEEKALLEEKLAAFRLEGVTIRSIFDDGLYHEDGLRIL